MKLIEFLVAISMILFEGKYITAKNFQKEIRVDVDVTKDNSKEHSFRRLGPRLD